MGYLGIKCPKLCTHEMIDSILHFIAIELKLKIRNQISSIDEIIGEDPEEELRNDLLHKQKLYSEAILTFDQFSKHK